MRTVCLIVALIYLIHFNCCQESKLLKGLACECVSLM